MVLAKVLLAIVWTDPLWMTFLVVSSMVPHILVAGMLRLVVEMVMILFGLVVHQLFFQFVVEIAVLLYDAVMM